MGHGLDLDQLHPPQTRPIAIPTCARAIAAAPTAMLGRAEEANTQDYQSSAQDQKHEEHRGEVKLPWQGPC